MRSGPDEQEPWAEQSFTDGCHQKRFTLGLHTSSAWSSSRPQNDQTDESTHSHVHKKRLVSALRPFSATCCIAP
ncbi:hypothetical protein AAFF_G00338910 [Aldrovandia affinis]|uniref:Uncharacterized protein n=1 Tax=Aldrovandia affinis TaxID=143900 RepID=A0AAD7R678_9TELE|nr:hypothetical protein AAFF_G00338910 [Aldrovandia affinis]